MKRVDLIAPPMAGHLHPILGIAQRLAREDGLSVRVISTAGALPAIRTAGLTGIALVTGADEAIEAVVNPPYRIGSNPRNLVRQFRAAFALQATFQAELTRLWREERPDLTITDFTMAAVGPAADLLGVGWWTTHPSPCAIEGRAGPPAYLGGWRPGVSRAGRVRDRVGRAVVRRFKHVAPRLAGVRVEHVGVHRIHRPDGSESIYSPDRIFALTPVAIEYERHLPDAVRHVGPVLFTPSRPVPPPDLAPGRRHVLITAGTHLPWHKEEMVQYAARAAARLPDVEVHVSLGGSAPADLSRPAGVVVHDYVDYARDLARFDAVVHHGGTGVLGHTLAAGLPAVVWPVDYDQFDHAVRLTDAGVGVRLTDPADLPSRIREVLDDPSYAAAARSIATDIRRRPAVDAIAAEVRSRLFDQG